MGKESLLVVAGLWNQTTFKLYLAIYSFVACNKYFVGSESLVSPAVQMEITTPTCRSCW